MEKEETARGKKRSKKGDTGNKALRKKRAAASGKNKVQQGAMQKRSRFSVLTVTAGIIIVACALAYIHFHSSVRQPWYAKSASQVQTKGPKNDKPRFEVFPVEPMPAKNIAKKIQAGLPVYRQPSESEGLPKVAIIIDDIGYDKHLADKFLQLDAVFTYSILPFSRYSTEIAQNAAKKGYQVMLHLPMEPNEYPGVDPGPGALLASMTPDERIHQLELDLDAVPYITGVNNHMGSKLTTMSDEMNQILSMLKARGLFFIDSKTTAASQCRSSARMFKVPFAERDVFLDHIQTPEAIRGEIEQLIHVAEITGKAVGIGHPHELTYDVLTEMLPELKKKVKLVSASEVVEVW